MPPLVQLKTKETTAYKECYAAGEEVLVDFYGGILFVNYDDGGFDVVEKIVQTVPFYNTEAESTPLEISSSYGIQFATGMPFDKIQIAWPSRGDNVGSLRWTLYKWVTSYEASLNGEALATVDLINIVDGHVQYFTFNEEMEAGEYLFLIENITEDTNQVGIWGVTGTPEYAHLYKDGKFYTDASAAMCIDVIDTDTSYYGALSDANEGSGGNDTEKHPGAGDTAVQIIMFAVILAAATYVCTEKKKNDLNKHKKNNT